MMTGKWVSALLAMSLLMPAFPRAGRGDYPHQGLQFIPAYPGVVTKSQPDGTVFQARQFGDERYCWIETPEGYTIQQNRATRFFEYVRVGSNGQFELTGLIAGRDDPAKAGLAKKLRESKDVVAAKSQPLGRVDLGKLPGGAPRPSLFPPVGDVPVLVILANFNDTTPTITAAEFDLLFNGDPTADPPLVDASVSHYFREVSYGNLNLSATIIDWTDVPGDRVNYGDPDTDARFLVEDIIDILYAGGFDFSPYDIDGDGFLEPIIVIHFGRGEEVTMDPDDIRSHAAGFYPPNYRPAGYDVDTSSATPGTVGLKALDYIALPELLDGGIITVGMVAHELGHALGLPDLYDTYNFGPAIGNWDLMATGCWNSVTRPGDSPAHPSAWCKLQLGWIDPSQANGMFVVNKRPGAVFPPVEMAPFVLQIPMDSVYYSYEYLLLENRQQVGYDRALPGAGLLIWHIDDFYDNALYPYEDHRGVVLIQADSLLDLENARNQGDAGDPFPGTSGVRDLGPWSDYDATYFPLDTNAYTSYYSADTEDRNIWILNISEQAMNISCDLRFYPNLYFDQSSSIPLQTIHAPIRFKNGSQRPYYLPGDRMPYDLLLLNYDNNFPYAFLCEDSPPFWLEFWASLTGGLTLDLSLANSVRVDAGIPGNDLAYATGQSPIYSVPDGAYSVVAALDRPNEVIESAKVDNWLASRGSKILILRGSTNIDVAVSNFSFGPQPARPGAPIQLRGLIVNQGSAPSGPFWVEFWGSFYWPTKHYPTLDFFLCDSLHVPNLAPGQVFDLSTLARTLYGIPAHPPGQEFQMGCFVDRLDQVNETDETNNYQFVGLFTVSTMSGTPPLQAAAAAAPVPPPMPTLQDLGRMQLTKAEMVVGWSTATLSGLQPPPYLRVDATVHNVGLTTAPASWTHVYVSRDPLLSADDYLWVAGLLVPILPPGRSHSFAVPVAAPSVPLGAYSMLVQCDVTNTVDEAYEINNVFPAGPLLVGVDLRVELAAFQEIDPTSIPELGIGFAEPGTYVTLALRVANHGIHGSAPFWLETWGSRLGGFTLDSMLLNSEVVPGVGPLASVDLYYSKKVNSIGDGAYTVTAVADRPEGIAEVIEGNNRKPVAGKRLLHLRPLRPINLRVPVFQYSHSTVRRGAPLKWNGSVVNDGFEHSGPFWIEFYGSFDLRKPIPHFQLCDSILVENLRPGQQYFLTPYQRTLYPNIPTGKITVICVVDRIDQVCEWEESDNFKYAFDVTILP